MTALVSAYVGVTIMVGLVIGQWIKTASYPEVLGGMETWDAVWCCQCGSRIRDAWRPIRCDGTDECDECWLVHPGPQRACRVL